MELDVFITTDQVPVVFHGQDQTSGGCNDHAPGEISQLTTSKGWIGDLSLEEVQALEFRPAEELVPQVPTQTESLYPFPPPDPGRVPTLREAMTVIQQCGMRANVELKGPGTELPSFHLVDQCGLIESTTFSSFCHERVIHLKAQQPSARTALLFSSPLPADFVHQAVQATASEVHVRFDTFDAKVLAEAHASGIAVMVWFRGPQAMAECADDGVYEPDELRRVVRIGPDSICTNIPNVLRDILNEYKTVSSRTG